MLCDVKLGRPAGRTSFSVQRSLGKHRLLGDIMRNTDSKCTELWGHETIKGLLKRKQSSCKHTGIFQAHECCLIDSDHPVHKVPLEVCMQFLCMLSESTLPYLNSYSVTSFYFCLHAQVNNLCIKTLATHNYTCIAAYTSYMHVHIRMKSSNITAKFSSPHNTWIHPWSSHPSFTVPLTSMANIFRRVLVISSLNKCLTNQTQRNCWQMRQWQLDVPNEILRIAITSGQVAIIL